VPLCLLDGLLVTLVFWKLKVLCVAVCCSVLHCEAVCCSMLQCFAAGCSVFQHIAACSNVMQRICVYACACVCISAHTRINTCVHARHISFLCMYVIFSYIWIYEYMHICICTYISAYVYLYIYVRDKKISRTCTERKYHVHAHTLSRKCAHFLAGSCRIPSRRCRMRRSVSFSRFILVSISFLTSCWHHLFHEPVSNSLSSI